jgi:sec-independent protein translocase protein TatB
MPQIGWFEILIIVGIAIIVVGPKDFPFILKKVGSWVGNIKRYVSNFQDELSDFDQKKIDVDLEEKQKENNKEDEQ